MTTPLMPLHIAPDTKSFGAAHVRALERLLARVRMAVDFETRGPAEGLVARGADVAVLRGREGRGRGGADVVVVHLRCFPDVVAGAVGGGGGRRRRRRRRRGEVMCWREWTAGLVGWHWWWWWWWW